MKIFKHTLQLAAAVSLVTAVDSWADTQSGSSAVAVLSSIPNAALPAKAAQIVAGADYVHQALVTSDVVKSALEVNPASATLVVASIARAVPAMAADAALAAITRFPSQTPAIVKAAVSAAPQMVSEIVKVLCRAEPVSYRAIAEAAANAAPGSAHEILEAVASAIPSMRATLSQVEAAHEGGYFSVYEVLAEVGDFSQVQLQTAEATPNSSGFLTESSRPHRVTIKAPPVVVVTIPTPVTPSAGTVVVAGGRTDAKP